MPPSPVEQANGIATAAITLAGRPIDPRFDLVSLEIWQAAGLPARARLTFHDGDPAVPTFALSEGADLAPGVEVGLSLGYGAVLTPLFTGVIQGQGLRGDASGPSLLVIEAVDQGGTAKTDGATGGPPVLSLVWGQSILDLNLDLEAGVQGTVRFQGSALPRPGCTVELQGLGGRFNGDALVTGVHQRLLEGLWTTEVTVERAAPHRVGRLVIEAALGDGAAAEEMRQRLERMAGAALPAALEQAFDDLGLGAAVVKLDRLDLALGTVRPEHLEEDLLAALGRALPAALRQALAGRQAP
ncbi:contractile injection system tape measure protein [Caulobacter sp. NIBR1757]|uniref:contractile injection system tape measure protein n=1 Tax=Caulobacter sp. NIBR1757 TaxID=3016000 RepID=UPI0022F1275C|nr:contractile injection system tape measure protein [Caulobacter sp. NIBR1757]WGM39909.1 hypothetical protein AMEJIAPC_02849 [Caulobacter sp. NIBR1757]